MPSWLQSLGSGDEIHWNSLIVRLLLAALAGLIVAGVYRVTQRRVGSASFSLITTLVLLTILVAMTTVVIGDNVARAFGLVGALSIVRFRTVVDDTRDTSFVIFAVVVGMALGAGRYDICIVGIPVMAAVAYGMSRMQSSGEADVLVRRLEVRISAGHDPARQGTAFDLVYRVWLRDQQAMLPLVKAINLVEGVQSVELREE
jgi:membrane-associated HD superfamily phosphohydrolase